MSTTPPTARRRRARKSENGILSARPGGKIIPSISGVHRLGLSGERDGILYVPAVTARNVGTPLIVALHGAGGKCNDALELFRKVADRTAAVVLAVDSRAFSWEGSDGSWGPDVEFIDLALHHAFEHCRIDADRIAIGGFSDGASYALSLGLANGDLFTHVIAFSPGYLRPPGHQSHPRIFVSHGRDDPLLPIRCSTGIVTNLRRAGYEVRFEEHPGGHRVPAEISDLASGWFMGESAPNPLERVL